MSFRKPDVIVIPSPLSPPMVLMLLIRIWTAGLHSHLWCLIAVFKHLSWFLGSAPYSFWGSQICLFLSCYLLTPCLDPPGYWGVDLSGVNSWCWLVTLIKTFLLRRAYLCHSLRVAGYLYGYDLLTCLSGEEKVGGWGPAMVLYEILPLILCTYILTFAVPFFSS